MYKNDTHINVQVNGIQIEDLYLQWRSYKRKYEEIKENNRKLHNQLYEQGICIENLKNKIKEMEGKNNV